MKQDIFSQIEQERDFWATEQLDSNPEYAKTHKKLLEMGESYSNSKFLNGARDSEGFKKYFFNISNFRCDTAKKNVDLDTKDVKIMPESGNSYYGSWFMEKELRLWMKEKAFARDLNKIIENLPRYGTVVVKKIKGDINIVNLKNFFSDPTVSSLNKSDFIIERYFFTPQELRKQNWDNTEEVILDYRERKGADKGEYIEVFERYGEVPSSWLDDRKTGFTYARFIVYKGRNEGTDIILHQDKTDSHPYSACHWERVSGRWLGRGVIESLFENQIRANEIANQKAKGLKWSSLHLFQTRDDLVKRNLLSDARNGDVMRVRSEIGPIATEERNLAAYATEERRWDANADRKTFAYDVIRGERSPAGTPLGSAILQSEQAGGYYDLKRENISIFIKELLMEHIIPQFEKEKRVEHYLSREELTPDELDRLSGFLLSSATSAMIARMAASLKRVPNSNEFHLALNTKRAQMREGKVFKVPGNFYDNLKYKIKVVITGESVGLNARLTALQTALGYVFSNPAALENPRVKRYFFKFLDTMGINPRELEPRQEERTLTEVVGSARRGGGMAAPRQPTAPTRKRTQIEV